MYDTKKALAEYVLPMLRDKKIIGLGTGKTVRKLVEVLQNANLLHNKIIITSSVDTDLLVSRYTQNVLSPLTGAIPEIYIDSFDFFLNSGDEKILVKGGGGALLREKILSFFSTERIFIGEKSKVISKRDVLVPIEIAPFALSFVVSKLRSSGLNPTLRESNGKMGPIVTDNGNVLVDVSVETSNLCALEREIKSIPGVIETGIFCEKLYDMIVIADEGGTIEIFQRSRESDQGKKNSTTYFAR
ncbi:MAG: ribose 5-phosphate isomerase A [Metallosphaera sp.]|uniref:ribose 5-phosphate isomerase A n=1 Tax=Metallosphaera sp. TaxID=2020860 RepID=UPI0031645995